MKDIKTALITGSNRGLGFELLKSLSSEGYNIIACTRSKNSDFTKEIEQISKTNNNKIYNIIFDLSDLDETQNQLSKFLNNYEQSIDVLINNAGVLKNSLMLMTPIKEVENIFKRNHFLDIVNLRDFQDLPRITLGTF